MELIPERIINEVSNAEARVFRLLRDLEYHENAVVLHSLNCSEHKYKSWSEIDFCLVLPEGIFILEVKGGGVKYTNGVWEFQGLHNRRGSSKEGPFNQAKSARYALEKLLKDKFKLDRAVREWPMIFGWGVVFTDQSWTFNSVEWPKELVADNVICNHDELFRDYIRTLVQYWKGKDNRSNRLPLNKKEIEKIRNCLRPNVDFLPPFEVGLTNIKGKLTQFTDQQFEIVVASKANKQIIVEGAAGTGKTFTALQMARLDAAKGLSVLFVTDSAILANHLAKNETDLNLNILSFSKLVQRRDNEQFDVLYVDEGQDLCGIQIFDILSEKLVGGLENGTWRWFMDPNKQSNLRGTFEPEALELLRSGFGHLPTSSRLIYNVRNTQQIIEFAENETGARLGSARIKDEGDEPIIRKVPAAKVAYEVKNTIDYYRNRDVNLEDIGLVFSSSFSSDLQDEIISSFQGNVVKLSSTAMHYGLQNKVLYSDVGNFKGLEKLIIIAVGFNSYAGTDNIKSKNEKYVAITRANFSVTLIDLED